MSQARRRRTNTNRKLIITGLREILFIFFCFLGLYLFVSLFTYYPLDPSLFHDNTGIQEIHNKGGLAGALLADLFLKLFGYFAYLFAYMIGYVGWIIYQGKHQDMLAEPRELIIPGVGFLLTLSAGCGLAIVHFAAESALLPSHAGGVLGNLVGKNIESIFSQLGATLILLAVFFTGVTMLTGLSWLKLMDVLGFHTLRLLPVVEQRARERVLPFLARHLGHFFQFTRERTVRFWHYASARGRELKTRGEAWWEERQARKQQRLEQEREAEEAEYEYEEDEESEAAPALPPDELPITAPEDLPEALLIQPRESLLPRMTHLERPDANTSKPEVKPIFMRVQLALQKLKADAKVKGVYPGPVLSRVEIKPGQIDINEVVKLSEQLVEQLGIPGVHVQETSPGMLSLEIPNAQPRAIFLSELLESDAYLDGNAVLSIALGKDVVGIPVIADLARMPHLMLAGSNAADINRALHGVLLSLLYRLTARECRLLLLDSAHKAFTVYDPLPHLLAPVTREIKHIRHALRWCVGEIEHRYAMMAELGVRNIEGYNRKVTLPEETAEGFTVEAPPLPYIIVLIHEVAELFAEDHDKEIEDLFIRLAQKARAAGIHMVIATQQPSVHVITGVMKNNFPTRIVFQVANKGESRVALGLPGAESLLGNGDMFYLTPGTATPARIHSAQVLLDEVRNVVEELRVQDAPEYAEELDELDISNVRHP